MDDMGDTFMKFVPNHPNWKLDHPCAAGIYITSFSVFLNICQSFRKIIAEIIGFNGKKILSPLIYIISTVAIYETRACLKKGGDCAKATK